MQLFDGMVCALFMFSVGSYQFFHLCFDELVEGYFRQWTRESDLETPVSWNIACDENGAIITELESYDTNEEEAAGSHLDNNSK